MSVRVDIHKLCFGGTYVYFRVYTPVTEKIKYRVAFVGSPVCDAQAYAQLCRNMADNGCLCVNIELPGFGHSPVMAPQDNATRARILWGVLDDVEDRRGEEMTKWHLVSHGSSCGIVLEMTRTQPGSVLSRTLIAPVFHRFGFSRRNYRLSGLRKWFFRQVYSYYIEDKRRFCGKLRTLFGYDLTRERADKLYEEFSRPGCLETLFMLLDKGFYINEGAFDVECPVMVLYGSMDPFCTDAYALVRALDEPGEAFGPRRDQPLVKFSRKRRYVEAHQLYTCHVPMDDEYEDEKSKETVNLNQAIQQYLLGLIKEVDGKIKTPKKKP